LNKKIKVVGPWISDELRESEIILINITQDSYWSREMNDLNKYYTLTVKSKKQQYIIVRGKEVSRTVRMVCYFYNFLWNLKYLPIISNSNLFICNYK